MLNTYPLWKYLLILAVLVLGCVYAAPNLYPPDYAVQITNRENDKRYTEGQLQQAGTALDDAGIAWFGGSLKDGKGLIRFHSDTDQLRAHRLLSCTLGADEVVVFNMAETTPQWLRDLGAEPMKYGLDLRGGVHFLLEVDTEAFLAKRMESLVKDIKAKIREADGFRYQSVEIAGPRTIRAVFSSLEARRLAEDLLQNQYAEVQIARGDTPVYFLDFLYTDEGIKEVQNFAVGQNIQTIRNRVNELGVSEPLVQRLGANRIVVDLPGVQDPSQARRIINKIATLEFYWEADGNTVRSQSLEYDYEGRAVRLDRRVIITGERVVDAKVGYDPDTSLPQTNITLDSKGGEIMHRATLPNVGRRMAVLFIETKSRKLTGEEDTVTQECSTEAPTDDQTLSEERYQEKRIISLATVQSPLGVQFRITGLKAGEARDLALLLRAGALAADMYFVEERTVGASLGEENIELGTVSVAVGLGLVLIFMLFYYKVFGLAANVALMGNLVLLVAVMSSLGATLTLPGIAGIVLTVGMAVDANVLIFSRIREELRAGLAPQAAINAGYQRAFVTIVDANLTTLLVALVLYSMGTGPIKGFAVTLSIGILTSMFTAIMGTRAMINLIYGGRNIKKLMI